jgi:inosine-uridine nucleoside N-ribohydrolase
MPVIVDTDMNSDDIMALAYLLRRGDVAVQAITVAGDGIAHGPAGARNAQRLARALRPGQAVPVAYGPARPLAETGSFPASWRAAADRMFGLGLPAAPGPAPRADASGQIIGTLRRAARPVTLITLGPLTDLALALRADPGIAGKIAMVYSMAGALSVPGNVPAHQPAEWNIYIDPRAADIVLESGVRVTWIPLDATNNVPITSFALDAARSARPTAALRIVTTLLADPYLAASPSYFWDPLAAVTATDNPVARFRTVRVAVAQAAGPGLGATRISAAGARVRAATAADAPAFEQRFLSTLAGHPVRLPVTPPARRLQVSFNGTTFGCAGPATAPAGRLSVRLANHSQDPYGSFRLGIVWLAPGHGMADVQAAIGRHLSAVPGWAAVITVLPSPPGSDPAWAVTLLPGRYALIGVTERDGTLHALRQLLITAD